jgi:hypothetical protein
VILDIKGSRQESTLKQKGVSWSLSLIVHNLLSLCSVPYVLSGLSCL